MEIKIFVLSPKEYRLLKTSLAASVFKSRKNKKLFEDYCSLYDKVLGITE